jgi:hypothetical protein
MSRKHGTPAASPHGYTQPPGFGFEQIITLGLQLGVGWGVKRCIRNIWAARYNRYQMLLQVRGRLWVKMRNTRRQQMFSELPPISDIAQHERRVRKVPISVSCTAANRIFGVGEQRVGSLKPSAMAALRLIINSNLVGCRTGMVCELFAL